MELSRRWFILYFIIWKQIWGLQYLALASENGIRLVRAEILKLYNSRCITRSSVWTLRRYVSNNVGNLLKCIVTRRLPFLHSLHAPTFLTSLIRLFSWSENFLFLRR